MKGGCGPHFCGGMPVLEWGRRGARHPGRSSGPPEAQTAKAAEEEEARLRAWELAQEAAAEEATGRSLLFAKDLRR